MRRDPTGLHLIQPLSAEHLRVLIKLKFEQVYFFVMLPRLLQLTRRLRLAGVSVVIGSVAFDHLFLDRVILEPCLLLLQLDESLERHFLAVAIVHSLRVIFNLFVNVENINVLFDSSLRVHHDLWFGSVGLDG